MIELCALHLPFMKMDRPTVPTGPG